MLTGGATNRIPAVNAGGWSVPISHIQASTFARTAADRSTHRDNLKPIWGCYCDNGANSINFEADTRPVARTAVTRASTTPKALSVPEARNQASILLRQGYGGQEHPASVALPLYAGTRASSTLF